MVNVQIMDVRVFQYFLTRNQDSTSTTVQRVQETARKHRDPKKEASHLPRPRHFPSRCAHHCPIIIVLHCYTVYLNYLSSSLHC